MNSNTNSSRDFDSLRYEELAKLWADTCAHDPWDFHTTDDLWDYLNDMKLCPEVIMAKFPTVDFPMFDAEMRDNANFDANEMLNLMGSYWRDSVLDWYVRCGAGSKESMWRHYNEWWWKHHDPDDYEHCMNCTNRCTATRMLNKIMKEM